MIIQQVHSRFEKGDELCVRLPDNSKETIKIVAVELDNIQLKKALLEGQGRMSLDLEELQKNLDETLNSVKASFESMDKNVANNCGVLLEKADAIKDLKGEIDDILMNYNKDLDKAAKDQFQLLQNDCSKTIDECNKRVGEIKTDVLSFLLTCSEQNQELIKKKRSSAAGSTGWK